MWRFEDFILLKLILCKPSGLALVQRLDWFDQELEKKLQIPPLKKDIKQNKKSAKHF